MIGNGEIGIRGRCRRTLDEHANGGSQRDCIGMFLPFTRSFAFAWQCLLTSWPHASKTQAIFGAGCSLGSRSISKARYGEQGKSLHRFYGSRWLKIVLFALLVLISPVLTMGVQVSTQAELEMALQSHRELTLTADLQLLPSFDSHTAIGLVGVTNLTILGNGYTVHGGGKLRCFSIANSSVTMKDLSITGCDAGLALESKHQHEDVTPQLRSSVHAQSTSEHLRTEHGHGGAAIIASNSTLFMTNCKLTSNTAVGSFGAGLYLTDAKTNVLCSGCHFSSNSAALGGDVYIASAGAVFATHDCPSDLYQGGADGHTLDLYSRPKGQASPTYSYHCSLLRNATTLGGEHVSRRLQSVFQPADRDELQTAVNAWISDESSALSTYGHINTWDTSLVTDMSYMFYLKRSFNGNISSWNTSSVTDMR